MSHPYEPAYCDHCGDECHPDGVIYIAELPCNVDSANKGESACLCFNCHEEVINKP